MAYTAPRTWVTGELVTAAMLNEQIRDNTNAAFPLGVDAWTAWTPTLTQNVTVTKTVNYAKYQKLGRTTFFRMKLTVTGTGSASQAVVVGLPPITCVETADYTFGQGYLFDVSASTSFKFLCSPASVNSAFFLLPTDGTVANVLGPHLFTAALAAGDVIVAAGMYEGTT